MVCSRHVAPNGTLCYPFKSMLLFGQALQWSDVEPRHPGLDHSPITSYC